MNADRRFSPWIVSVLALVGAGCSGDLTPSTTSVLPTPPDVLAPEGPKETATASEPKKEEAAEKTGTADTPKVDVPEATGEVLLKGPEPADPAAKSDSARQAVGLQTITIDEFKKRIAKNQDGVKYSVVDGWATYCPPCMENFPHLVEMHEKYADQGLRVISVSFDDTSVAGDVKKAEEFLKAKHAVFENYVFSGDMGETYEYFDVSAIPAVFVYGPDGKEVKRFTYDDPDNQFTYDEVEAYLKELLSGEKAEKTAER